MRATALFHGLGRLDPMHVNPLEDRLIKWTLGESVRCQPVAKHSRHMEIKAVPHICMKTIQDWGLVPDDD